MSGDIEGLIDDNPVEEEEDANEQSGSEDDSIGTRKRSVYLAINYEPYPTCY